MEGDLANTSNKFDAHLNAVPSQAGIKQDDIQMQQNDDLNVAQDLDAYKKLTNDKLEALSLEIAQERENLKTVNETVNTLTGAMEKGFNRIESLEISDRDHVVIIDGVEVNEDKSLLVNTVDALNRYSDIRLYYNGIAQCNYFGNQTRDGMPRPVRLT